VSLAELQLPATQREGCPDVLGAGTADTAAPRITVLVPWIGRPQYIEHALAALLRQDYPNLEILVSDNSLTPQPHPFASISDPRVRVVRRSERRLSAAEHYNLCLLEAQGVFVMILSDDDLIGPKYVSSMYEAFLRDPGVKVCVGEQIAIGPDDLLAPSDAGPVSVRIYAGVSFVLSRLVRPRALPLITYMSLMARRSDMLSLGYRDYPQGSNADNFMMFALALSGHVAVSTCKMYYRIYEASAGLAMPFGRLLVSCVEFEADIARLLRGRRGQIHARQRCALRLLIRARNFSMMSRRLLTLYRRRLDWRAYGASLLALLRYGFLGSASAAAGSDRAR
jgi:glycosyltransferase involved in cell wall biosynthesis